ncbi:MAG: alpha-L-fucosidase [Planctomycetes bacterium]|nr:alpha-L-fucosidase [Planctomycetota bacterium]
MLGLPVLRAALCVASIAVPAAAQADPSSVVVPPGASADEIAALAARVLPHPRQQRWLSLGFTAFVHFGMNTFTDREWGDGREEPDRFRPDRLDADQWCEAFAAAGMRGVVLTCKHHDGFCLWPTATTDHSVRSSDWRAGEGDVVREVADACRRHGLLFGVYLSPWDRNAPSFGTHAYDDLFHAQLRELLTGYGPLYDVWFDGAHAPKDDPETFDWLRHFRLIRELQPDACISVMGPDARWCGNEAGHTREQEWNVVPLDIADPRPATDSWDVFHALLRVPVQAADLGSRARLAGAKRLVWWPTMTNTSIRPGWFWHPAEDGRVKSLDALLDVWFGAVGGGSQFLLNVPPNRHGRLADGDVERLRQLGTVLRATFGRDLAAGARREHDANLHTLLLPEPRGVDVVRVCEDVAHTGQRVEAFRLDARIDGAWREIARGSTIGPNRLLRFAPVNADAFRLVVEQQRAPAQIAELALFRQPGVLRAPRLARARDGAVTIDAPPGAVVRVTLDGSAPTETSPRYTGPVPLPDGGLLRARTFAPDDGRQWLALEPGAYEATARFGLAPATLTVVGTDSEQPPGEAASLAIDGNPSTHWHSRWSPDAPDHPHWLTVDTGASHPILGVTLLPRQDGSTNGAIVRCDVATSVDGTSWSAALTDAELANVANHPVEQTLLFDRPTEARFVRITSRAAVDGRPWASLAELGVLVR